MLAPHRCCLATIAVLAALVSHSAAAQSAFGGLGVHYFTGGGRGIEGTCLEGSTNTGLAVRAGYDIVDRIVAVQGTARFHLWTAMRRCMDGFPPAEGTFIDLDRQNLLTRAFTATDVQVRLTFPVRYLAPAVAAGIGQAWRSGNDLPYFVLTAILIVPTPAVRFLLAAEWYRVRVGFERVQRTWQDFTLIEVVPLGTVHEWNSSAAVGFGVEFPFTF